MLSKSIDNYFVILFITPVMQLMNVFVRREESEQSANRKYRKIIQPSIGRGRGLGALGIEHDRHKTCPKNYGSRTFETPVPQMNVNKLGSDSDGYSCSGSMVDFEPSGALRLAC